MWYCLSIIFFYMPLIILYNIKIESILQWGFWWALCIWIPLIFLCIVIGQLVGKGER